MSLVEHRQCAICYEIKQITTYCKRCTVCQICEICTGQIAKMSEQPQKCPTCRYPQDWKTDTIYNQRTVLDLQTQVELIPQIIIHEITGPPTVSRQPQSRRHYHLTCNCITINCPDSETIQVYGQHYRDMCIRQSNNCTSCKQLIGIVIICYIIGLITAKIIQESTEITLHGPNGWIWVPLIIGFLILTILICTFNRVHNPRIFIVQSY